MTPSKSLYLNDQGWSLCTTLDDPLSHLSVNPGRTPQGAASAGAEDNWEPVPREAVLNGRVVRGAVKHPLLRVAVTSDAGGGKSEALTWLATQWNRPRSGRIAVRISAERFFRTPLVNCNAVTIHGALLNVLAEECAKRVISAQKLPDDKHPPVLDAFRRLLERARHRGTLVLLVDGLDQIPQQSPLLDEVLTSGIWERCGMVVAGRPYALVARKQVFGGPAGLDGTHPLRWRFLRLEPLTKAQITRYLRLGEEGRPAYDDLPDGVQRMMGSPRVISYMRTLPPREYSQLTSAADLYERVLDRLIVESLNNSRDVRLLGHTGREDEVPSHWNDTQRLKIWELLGCIAYTQLFHSEPKFDPKLKKHVPVLNFGGVPPETPFLQFKKKLEQRYTSPSRGGMNWDWQAMAALGTPLRQGVFEADRGARGLNQIEFQDRTLLEFLVARHLATRGGDDEAQLLAQHVYRPDRPLTNEMYWVWQYLCELPEGVIAKTPQNWLRMVAPLYRPAFRINNSILGSGVRAVKSLLRKFGLKGIRCSSGDWSAERSTEMIFRSWPRLNALCEAGGAQEYAQSIRDEWWGEFEAIADGIQGVDRQRAALAFQEDFLNIPSGRVTLGSPAGHGRFDDANAAVWRRWLADALAASNPNAWLTSWIEARDRRRFFGVGAGREDSIAEWTGLWPELWQRERESAGEGFRSLEQVVFPNDEARQDDVPVEAFALGRSPVLNDWYRLFAPDHGLSPTPWAEDYHRYSAEGSQPAIFVSFYDAWAFCLWARFENQSCRLPWEHEWEHVAKLGVPWDWAYWWHETEFRHEKATAYQKDKPPETTPPTPAHANPATKALDPAPAGRGLGVMDQLGNVWEWCQDHYEGMARRAPSDAPGTAGRSRVLRGGSFNGSPVDCRATIRDLRHPSYIDGNGFRAARACSPR